jgi:integrase
MASIIPRENDAGEITGWQAKIRKKGFPPVSKTFLRRADAEAWAKDQEVAMQRGLWRDTSEAEATTLGETLERYLREVTPRKKGAKREAARIKVWLERPIAKRSLASIRGSDIAAFRDAERRRGLAENSIRIEIALLSHVFEVARREWGMEGLQNPCRTIRLPGGSKRRERRLEGDEETRLLDAIGKAMPRSPGMRALLVVAIETGMRQGELLRLRWSDVDLARRVAHLDDTKSGDPRDVPLSLRAIEALRGLPRRIDGRVFGITQDRLIRGFARACGLAEIDGLKFHDLRHEAASRLAGMLQAHELAKMFGWRTLQMALRYYHPRAEDLARKLG